MKALQQIIQRVAEYPAQPWALATLVQTRGSTYRKAGARLLVDPNGGTVGFLTGGCLEEEIGRQGREVIRDGSPVLLSFDTRRLYGCDGLLKILLEPLAPAGENGNLITHIGRSLRNREVCRVRTRFEGTKLGSEILRSSVLLTERAGVFIETLALPIRLLLFGAGPEIEPVTQLATTLGWMVERFGHPSELAARFPERYPNRRRSDESQFRSRSSFAPSASAASNSDMLDYSDQKNVMPRFWRS